MSVSISHSFSPGPLWGFWNPSSGAGAQGCAYCIVGTESPQVWQGLGSQSAWGQGGHSELWGLGAPGLGRSSLGYSALDRSHCLDLSAQDGCLNPSSFQFPRSTGGVHEEAAPGSAHFREHARSPTAGTLSPQTPEQCSTCLTTTSMCSACEIVDPDLLSEGSAPRSYKREGSATARVGAQETPPQGLLRGREVAAHSLLCPLRARRSPAPRMVRAAGPQFPGFSARAGRDWACASPGGGAAGQRGSAGSTDSCAAAGT